MAFDLNRLAFWRGMETRADEESWRAAAGELSTGLPAPTNVTYRNAESSSAVYACTQAISGDIATLPFWVYQRTEKGRQVLEDHWLMRFFRSGPNEYAGWEEFWSWYIASILLQGNGLAEIERDGRGGVAALHPIPWNWVTNVELGPSGRPVFDFTDQSKREGDRTRNRRLLADQVLHIKDRTDGGLVGVTRLSRAGAALSGALDIDTHAHAMLALGASPSMVIMYEKALSETAFKNVRESIRDKYSGAKNAGRPMLIEGGPCKVQTLSMTPQDQELLQARRFSVEEVCRVFEVPSPIVNDLSNATFTNSETMLRWYAMRTLKKWAEKLEGEIRRQLLTESAQRTHSVEFDLSGLLRGDPGTRWQNHVAAVNAGILTPNEVRESEGWNPHEAGSELRNPQASGGLTDGN